MAPRLAAPEEHYGGRTMGVIQSLWKKFFEPSHVNRAEAPSHASKQPVADEAETLRSYDAKRSEEHTSELQSLMRISYAVFCLKKKTRMQVNEEEQIRHRYTIY